MLGSCAIIGNDSLNIFLSYCASRELPNSRTQGSTCLPFLQNPFGPLLVAYKMLSLGGGFFIVHHGNVLEVGIPGPSFTRNQARLCRWLGSPTKHILSQDPITTVSLTPGSLTSGSSSSFSGQNFSSNGTVYRVPDISVTWLSLLDS